MLSVRTVFPLSQGSSYLLLRGRALLSLSHCRRIQSHAGYLGDRPLVAESGLSDLCNFCQLNGYFREKLPLDVSAETSSKLL